MPTVPQALLTAQEVTVCRTTAPFGWLPGASWTTLAVGHGETAAPRFSRLATAARQATETCSCLLKG